MRWSHTRWRGGLRLCGLRLGEVVSGWVERWAQAWWRGGLRLGGGMCSVWWRGGLQFGGEIGYDLVEGGLSLVEGGFMLGRKVV